MVARARLPPPSEAQLRASPWVRSVPPTLEVHVRRIASLTLLIVMPACAVPPASPRIPPIPTATWVPTPTITPTFIPLGTPSPRPVADSSGPPVVVVPTSNLHGSRP